MTFSLGRRRAIFAAAAAAYVLSQFYRSFLTVVFDDLARDLGIGPQEFGALGAAWFFAFSLSQFAVGMALDRLGPRRTMAGMMVFAVIGALMFAAARSPMTALAGMALVGVGCAPILMGTLYFFAKVEAPARFAALSSLFLSVGLIGSLVSSTPLALLVQAVGWRVAIQLVAAVTALVTVLIYLVFRDPPVEPSPPGGSLIGDLVTLLRAPGMAPILVIAFAVSAPIFTERSLWVGPFFGEVHGLNPVQRGNAALALAIAMTISAVLAGPIAGRIGSPKKVVFVGNFVCGLMFLALGLWPGLPLSAAIVLMGLAGLFGLTYAVMMAHGRLFMPGHVIGRGITFINFVSIGGTGVVQYASGHAVGAMRDAGLAPAAIYGHLHLAFGALLVIAALTYLRAPEKPAG